jgi:serine/threonine protein kinase
MVDHTFKTFVTKQNEKFDISKIKWELTNLRQTTKQTERKVIPHLKYMYIDTKFYKCRIISRGHRSIVYTVVHNQFIIKVRKSEKYSLEKSKNMYTVHDGEYKRSLLVKHIPQIIQPIYSCVFVNGTFGIFELNIYDRWDGDIFDLCIRLMKQSIHQHIKTPTLSKDRLLQDTTIFLLHLLKSLRESSLLHTDIKLENIFFKWDSNTSSLQLILGDIEGLCKKGLQLDSWEAGQGTSEYRRSVRAQCPDFEDDAYASYKTLMFIIDMKTHISLVQAKKILTTEYNTKTHSFINILCDYILPMLKNGENSIQCMQMSINVLVELNKIN